MTIYLEDRDFTLHLGDVTDCLRDLPDGSVHCVVTSPPYWGLRDYGTGSWTGGDENCDHMKWKPWIDSKKQPGSETYASYRDVCGKCGATRTDQKLGLEPTADAYVQKMVEVFREVRRVLRDDGTLWLNLGDSYFGTGRGPSNDHKPAGLHSNVTESGGFPLTTLYTHDTLKSKDLIGIPWRVAFALQADGWYLRSDIIWSKPNPMPESVTDRPTKAHEYVFLLSKGPRYFFDQEAVREQALWADDPRAGNGHIDYDGKRKGEAGTGQRAFVSINPAGRNVRSVWEIATQPYAEAHFATYPEELVRRCILAGTSERGCCPVCGKPWEREVETPSIPAELRNRDNGAKMDYHSRQTGGGQNIQNWRNENPTRTLGWRPSCRCGVSDEASDLRPPPVPCTVLDPFMGSGTTAHVARKHGRRSIGIELNPAYAELCARRLQQQSLFA